MKARFEHGQAFRGDEAVVGGAVGTPKTVGEVEEEAGEGAEAEEDVDHQGVHVGAVARFGDCGKNHLEGQEGSGWEEVDEHGGLGEGLLDALCNGTSFSATFFRRSLTGSCSMGRCVFLWWTRACIVHFDSYCFISINMIHFSLST